MSSSFASMSDAKAYFDSMPDEFENKFNSSQYDKFQILMTALDEFFKLTAAIDLKAENGQIIVAEAATEIGDHGLTLLRQVIELIQQIALPLKRQELEQIALVFSTWIIQYDGKINSLETIVNAFANVANSINSKKSLDALCEFMTEVIEACSIEIKHDFDSVNLYRPWRLLLINRGIVATRTNKEELMIKAFDDVKRYLPQDAPNFFKDGLADMDDKNYPEEVKQVLIEYHSSAENMRFH